MNTVGLFAGRGDVILAMLLAFVLGGLVGWHIRRAYVAVRRVLGLAKHNDVHP